MVQADSTTAIRGGPPRDGAAGPATADSGAQGRGAMRRRRHEEGRAPLVWLALGCALGWQDKVCSTAQNEMIVRPCGCRVPPTPCRSRHGPVLSGAGAVAQAAGWQYCVSLPHQRTRACTLL